MVDEKEIEVLNKFLNQPNVQRSIERLFESRKIMPGSFIESTLLYIFSTLIKEKFDWYKQQIVDAINMTNCLDKNSPFYPEGTRLCQRVGGKICLLVEQPPQVRTLRFAEALYKYTPLFGEKHTPLSEDKTTIRNLRVTLPYVYFFITYNDDWKYANTRLFFRNSPIRTWDDVLGVPNLPNISPSSCIICYGSGKEFELAGYNKIDAAQKLIDYFWSSDFNWDYSANYWEYAKANEKLWLPNWVNFTKSDSLEIFNFKWKPSYSIAELMAGYPPPRAVNEIDGVVSLIIASINSKFVDVLNARKCGYEEKILTEIIVKALCSINI